MRLFQEIVVCYNKAFLLREPGGLMGPTLHPVGPLSNVAIALRRRCSVGLSGGAVPEKVSSQHAIAEFAETVPVAQVHVIPQRWSLWWRVLLPAVQCRADYDRQLRPTLMPGVGREEDY